MWYVPGAAKTLNTPSSLVVNEVTVEPSGDCTANCAVNGCGKQFLSPGFDTGHVGLAVTVPDMPEDPSVVICVVVPDVLLD